MGFFEKVAVGGEFNGERPLSNAEAEVVVQGMIKDLEWQVGRAMTEGCGVIFPSNKPENGGGVDSQRDGNLPNDVYFLNGVGSVSVSKEPYSAEDIFFGVVRESKMIYSMQSQTQQPSESKLVAAGGSIGPREGYAGRLREPFAELEPRGIVGAGQEEPLGYSKVTLNKGFVDRPGTVAVYMREPGGGSVVHVCSVKELRNDKVMYRSLVQAGGEVRMEWTGEASYLSLISKVEAVTLPSDGSLLVGPGEVILLRSLHVDIGDVVLKGPIKKSHIMKLVEGNQDFFQAPFEAVDYRLFYEQIEEANKLFFPFSDN